MYHQDTPSRAVTRTSARPFDYDRKQRVWQEGVNNYPPRVTIAHNHK